MKTFDFMVVLEDCWHHQATSYSQAIPAEPTLRVGELLERHFRIGHNNPVLGGSSVHAPG